MQQQQPLGQSRVPVGDRHRRRRLLHSSLHDNNACTTTCGKGVAFVETYQTQKSPMMASTREQSQDTGAPPRPPFQMNRGRRQQQQQPRAANHANAAVNLPPWVGTAAAAAA